MEVIFKTKKVKEVMFGETVECQARIMVKGTVFVRTKEFYKESGVAMTRWMQDVEDFFKQLVEEE